MVRIKGLEPIPPCEDWHLKPARLPIPPHPHIQFYKIITYHFRFVNILIKIFQEVIDKNLQPSRMKINENLTIPKDVYHHLFFQLIISCSSLQLLSSTNCAISENICFSAIAFALTISFSSSGWQYFLKLISSVIPI